VQLTDQRLSQTHSSAAALFGGGGIIQGSGLGVRQSPQAIVQHGGQTDLPCWVAMTLPLEQQPAGFTHCLH
jgi:hypothetical protein